MKPLPPETWASEAWYLKTLLKQEAQLKPEDEPALDAHTTEVAEYLLEYFRMFAGPELYESLFGKDTNATALKRLENTLLDILLLDRPCRDNLEERQSVIDTLIEANTVINDDGYIEPDDLDIFEAVLRSQEILGLRIPPGMDYPVNTDPDAEDLTCKGAVVRDPFTDKLEWVRTTDYHNRLN